ncbi:MAG: succinyl-diaminopimelate desuccinylase [Hyphomicrobiales bacterium]|nr:succinyl-diaminopimelate desuccinylase [Hyphomicrobiales bacterium]
MTVPPPTDALSIAQALIRCPSVTPQEAGALDYLVSLLEPAGFRCTRLPFADTDTPDVDNLFARVGSGPPHLCFAGHTDVVPAGDEAAWTHPPFAGAVDAGWLYGRGAVDMKGGIACFAAAILAHLAENDGKIPGSVSFLITGDEEGPAINGTAKVLDWMAREGHDPDHCLVGEPSNPRDIGDEVKIGRRGSINGVLTVTGTAGHVAYPQLAANPIPGMLRILGAFLAESLDSGNDNFAPSNLEIATIDTGNETENVIPPGVTAKFNIRFNNEQSADGLKDLLRAQAAEALAGSGLDFDLSFSSSGEAFVTAPGPLIEVMEAAVKAATGKLPALSTGGGTSDARFIKDYCPVIEFGLVNKTIHQTDERTPVADLETLTAIYRDFIGRYFLAFGS